MKYLLIIVILIIYIPFSLFRRKKKSYVISQNTNGFDTNKNTPIQEKSTFGILKKIKNEEYNRFVLIKSTTESYILKGIKEYGQLTGNEEYKLYHFGISKRQDWIILKVDQSISFYVYHNLVAWLSEYKESSATPKLIFGFSKHKNNLEEDYLFYLDPKNGFGDTQIGSFRNGKSFSIFLPEAYQEYGNMTIKKEIQFSMKENEDYISSQGFNISDIESLEYAEHIIKMKE